MIEKTCGKCLTSKPREENFNKDKSQEDGYCRYCRACRTLKRQKWYTEHKEEKAVADKAYRERNKEKVSAHAAQYRKGNAETIKAYFRNRTLNDPEYAERKRRAARQWEIDNPEKKRARSRQYKATRRYHLHLKSRFGITQADYDAMVAAQGNLCAICGQPPKGKRPKLYVDHCHKAEQAGTMKIRQLLCQSCNIGLGAFRDDPDLLQAAIAYLARHA